MVEHLILQTDPPPHSKALEPPNHSRARDQPGFPPFLPAEPSCRGDKFMATVITQLLYYMPTGVKKIYTTKITYA